MKFGKHVKGRRLELGLSLRAFCMKYGEDPSNWSKLERGVNPPPQSFERLLEISEYLEYADNIPERQKLFDLAKIDRGQIPQDILDNAALMEKMPLVFRTLRETPTEGDLLRLADMIREAHTPDEVK